MTGLAVLFALLSAATAAFSTSVQHQAAETAPSHVTGAWGLLLHLVRRPAWLIGQLIGVLGLVFHGLSLNNGPIALVQPIVISGIVLAVPLRAAISRRLPGLRELAAVVLAAVGLAVFLVVSSPSAGRPVGVGPLPLVMVLVFLALGAGAVTLARRVGDPTRRAFLLGTSAGVLFALVAVSLKMTLDRLSGTGPVSVLTAWPLYVLMASGIGGVLTNQLAYRSGRLSSSMPVLNVVDCLVALLFGYVLFHEVPRHGSAVLLTEALALAAMLTGLWTLARDAANELALDEVTAPIVAEHDERS